jgi:hypothetical protein
VKKLQCMVYGNVNGEIMLNAQHTRTTRYEDQSREDSKVTYRSG